MFHWAKKNAFYSIDLCTVAQSHRHFKDLARMIFQHRYPYGFRMNTIGRGDIELLMRVLNTFGDTITGAEFTMNHRRWSRNDLKFLRCFMLKIAKRSSQINQSIVDISIWMHQTWTNDRNWHKIKHKLFSHFIRLIRQKEIVFKVKAVEL